MTLQPFGAFPIQELQMNGRGWSAGIAAKSNTQAITHLKCLKNYKNQMMIPSLVQFSMIPPKLEYLTLVSLTAKTIPIFLAKWPMLSRLFISRSFIQELRIEHPDGIGMPFPKLMVLSLIKCHLQRVDPSIRYLKELRELNLSENDLESIPESIGQLTHLQCLRLEINRLKSIPECIGQLTSLREIFLFKNQLESIPESIGNISFLQVLSLSDNKLRIIPTRIWTLHLQCLDISNNLIREIQKEVEFRVSPHLSNLYLDWNYLTTVPNSIRSILYGRSDLELRCTQKKAPETPRTYYL